jgi:predicted permease
MLGVFSVMDLFFLLLGKIVPLYALIALGFVAGRVLRVGRRSLSKILIQIIVPAVFFGAAATMELRPAYILLPFVCYGMAAITGTIMYHLSGFVYQDRHRNLIGQASSTANSGYLGVPVFAALYPDDISIYIFAALGVALCEYTLGLYFLARGHFSPRESLKKIAQMPVLYATAAGLALNASGIGLSQNLVDLWGYFRGAYVVLGIMIVGLGLSGVKSLTLGGGRFAALLWGQKFLLWPALAFGIVALDQQTMGMLDETARRVVMMISIMPLAGNTVAFAAHYRIHPEKAATTVFFSMFIGLVYIPVFVALFIH